jgi:hypothetical protein
MPPFFRVERFNVAGVISPTNATNKLAGRSPDFHADSNCFFGFHNAYNRENKTKVNLFSDEKNVTPYQ